MTPPQPAWRRFRRLLLRFPAAAGIAALSLTPGRAVLAPPSPLEPGYATPNFPAGDRRPKIVSVLPEIEREFREFAASKKLPGLVWGIVLDGELVHTGAIGLANVERRLPAARDTRFRIASMTKSFTALAILKLRDAGRLSLTDAVESHVPELRATPPLTTDSPPIAIHHLLTMGAGFPEDNPWGDRQLAVSDAALQQFLRDRLALSNPPDTAFEYSNLGYALLGRVIARVSGLPYQSYIRDEVLLPLGMKDTVWDYREVRAGKLALGYRTTQEGWQSEPLLGDGAYGAMGGLITTLGDFTRYAALHLAAWPARSDPDSGPIRRSTLREMHQPHRHSGFAPAGRSLAGEPLPAVSAYGYGLGWTTDSQRTVRIGHSGGLPGFGSNWLFFPDHGFAVISFANLTYAGTGTVNTRVGAILVEKAMLPRRVVPPSAVLVQRQRELVSLLPSWEQTAADAIMAENFFLDRSREEWARESREKLGRIGPIRSVGDLVPENQLRGTFPLMGEKGRIDVFFTLTPERTPRVQKLQLRLVLP